MRQNKERELQTIDAFFGEFLSYRSESIGIWFGAGFLSLIYGIYMCVPFAYHTEPLVDALMLFFGFFGPTLYLNPYRVYTNNFQLGGQDPQKIVILDKLAFLPVDFSMIRLYRMKKLAKYCGITGLIFAVGQLAFSYGITKEISWQSILFAVFAGLIWPYCSNSEWIHLLVERRK